MLEVGQIEGPEVARRDHVGEEQADHLTPHDVLATDPEIHVTGREVQIGLAEIELILLVAPDSIRVEAIVDGKHPIGVRTAGDFPLQAGLAALRRHLGPGPGHGPVILTGIGPGNIELEGGGGPCLAAGIELQVEIKIICRCGGTRGQHGGQSD